MTRLLQCLFPAFLLGALLGGIEAAYMLLSQPGIRLLEPLREVVVLMLWSGAMAALATTGVALLRRNWRPRTCASLGAALYLFAAAYLWVHSRILQGQPMFAPGGLLASAIIFGVCLVCWPVMRRLLVTKRFRWALPLALAVFALLPLMRRVTFDTELRDLSGDDLPNVTVLLLDTLRADRLSCYGYERADGQPTSPFLDSMAAAGTRFDWCYSAAPWTRPSVASIFSGFYPSTHGAYEPVRALPDWTVTIAEVFQNAGYRTAGFSANANISAMWGYHQGFQQFWCLDDKSLFEISALGDVFRRVRAKLKIINPTLDEVNLVNSQVQPWLDEVGGGERPVFTYVQYMDPHFPYFPPEDLLNADKPDFYALVDQAKEPEARPLPYPLGVQQRPDASLMDGFSRLYDAEVRWLDNGLEKFVANLRAAGLLGEDDWLIITSDHGEEFWEHEHWGHGQNLYHEVLRVPLIVIGPGVTAGKVVADPVSLVDLLPTLAEIPGQTALLREAIKKTDDGVPDPDLHHPGLSLAPLWSAEAGAEAADPRRIYSEKMWKPRQRALRAGSHKVIEVSYPDPSAAFNEDPEILEYPVYYDVGADPYEDRGHFNSQDSGTALAPIAAERFTLLPAGFEDAFNDLMEQMKALGLLSQALDQGPAGRPMSAAELQRMKDLGYMD